MRIGLLWFTLLLGQSSPVGRAHSQGVSRASSTWQPPNSIPPLQPPKTAGESASCSDSQPLTSAMNWQMCRGERWLRVWGPQVLAALVALRCLQAAVACHLFGSLRCPWQRGWSAASPSAFPRSGSQEFTAGLHGWTSPGEILVQMAGRQSLCVSPLLRRRVRWEMNMGRTLKS